MEECGSLFGGVILDPRGAPQCCRKLKPEEVQVYGRIMHKAWTDPKYRDRLLTFLEGQATDWIWYSSVDRASMLKQTREALQEFVPIGDDEYPVVLSEWQFMRGVYRMGDPNERVLQLPNNPVDGNPSFKPLMDDVSFRAYMIDSHICGM